METELTELKYERAEVQRVVVTDFNIPFWHMANLMVKFALATIPAAIALGVISFALLFVFSACTALLGMNM